jgi:Na+-translocating membrane potential-generating system (MpsC)
VHLSDSHFAEEDCTGDIGCDFAKSATISPTVASLTHPVEAAPASANGGSQLAELSRQLVQLMRRDAGRGPTRAKSYWAGPDILLTIFGDGFLMSERTLLDHGLEGVALAYRGAIQQTLRDAMRSEVERTVGRRVTAAMGCAHHDPDLMVELFFFEPLQVRSGGDRFADGDAGVEPASPDASAADGASG